MSDDTELKDAQQIFADTIEAMLGEYGLGPPNCTQREAIQIAALCTCEFDKAWADFMQWLKYGEDEQEKTRDIVRASLRVASMWR